MTLSTGNMSGYWTISMDGSPDIKPKLTAKCNNTILVQKQLSYASNNSSSNKTDNNNSKSKSLLKKLLKKN